MLFYLIRHAQSENNAKPEHERVHDPGITEIGQAQAAKVANRICAEIPFDVLITSAFRRALLTSDAIAKATTKTPQIVVDVHESGGCYSGWEEGKEVGMPGMNHDEIATEFSPIDIPNELGSEGWWQSRRKESDDQLVQRAKRMTEYFATRIEQEQKTLACVSHADFIAQFLRTALGDKEIPEPEKLGLKNTGISCLQWDGDSWSGKWINCDKHLSGELVTE